MTRKMLGKGLLAAIGVVCVGLAIAGIFLPLLPTTPFLLLAAASFVRSSDRLHRWLITHRWFGPYIRNYREHRAITRRAKVVTLLLLWGTLAYGVVAVVSVLPLRVLLLLIGAAVSFHVLRLKTLTQEMLSAGSEADGHEPDSDRGPAEKG
jgi:uncharacterized membrane protein YbaN (DUF454 family)